MKMNLDMWATRADNSFLNLHVALLHIEAWPYVLFLSGAVIPSLIWLKILSLIRLKHLARCYASANARRGAAEVTASPSVT